MIDLQMFLLTNPSAVWILGSIVLGVFSAYFFFFPRTDPRVKELARLAYKTAAKIAELPARGSPPPVNLRDGPWEHRGITIVGNYKWVGAFGKVFWDRILTTKDPTRIWEVLLHEMMHSVRRRNGLASSEAAAYATKILAVEMAPPNLAALLAKL